MATRSTIALEYADGTIDQIYCHWDGYISHNGEILQAHYTDPFKVKQMMDLGDLSTLGVDIGEQHEFDTVNNRDHEDWCKFYGRDRGEQDVKARRFENWTDYVENHQYEEYEYCLRRDGQWYVSKYSNDYKLLSDVIADELIEKEMAEEE